MSKKSEEYNGPFTKLHKKLGGDNVANNLRGFEFKKGVLRQYTDLSKNNPLEFRLEENAGVIYINHIGKWDLKCSLLKNGNIGVLFI